MTEKNDALAKEINHLVTTIDDPVELQEKICATISEAYPVKPKPTFAPGEKMALWVFERRFKKELCGNIEPWYAQSLVEVIGVHKGRGVLIEVFPPGVELLNVEQSAAVERPARGDVVEG